MSLNFGDSSVNRFKAQSAYKDASGMGGGGMYFQQKKKNKEEEEDIFQHNKDEKDNLEDDITFGDAKEEDIPRDTLFNKFVNWFRPND